VVKHILEVYRVCGGVRSVGYVAFPKVTLEKYIRYTRTLNITIEANGTRNSSNTFFIHWLSFFSRLESETDDGIQLYVVNNCLNRTVC